MRHVREILRLSLEAGLSTRVIGERLRARRAPGYAEAVCTLRAELASPCGDKRCLGTVPVRLTRGEAWPAQQGRTGRSAVARELKRKHVTLQVVWEEYTGAHQYDYRYSG